MIGHNIADLILKELNILKPYLSEIDKRNLNNTSIKGFLVDINEMHSYKIINNRNFSIEVKKEDYTYALMSDYWICRNRIIEQKNNVNILSSGDCQAAWLLITIYYCCFFIANQLSKLYGCYIVNFSKDDMEWIISQAEYSDCSQLVSSIESNNSYEVKVNQSEYEDLLLLNFIKSSPKPHLIVWKNLNSILKKLRLNDSLVNHLRLLNNILESKSGWESPNKIRNDWNYVYPDYYADKGNNISENFKKILAQSKSAFSWGSNRRVAPDDNNIVSSMAYIYHILNEADDRIHNKMNI